MNNDHDGLDLLIELGRLQRDTDAKVRMAQRGDAFVAVARQIAGPLLTTLVPDGMESSSIRKKQPIKR